MNRRQARFAAEYQVDLNAARAAARAGYHPDSGKRLLRRPEIMAAVRAGEAARAARLDLSAERVLAEYARIAFANIADYARFGPDGVELNDVTGLTHDQTAAVAEVTESKTASGGTVRFKLHDKLAALGALARHLGLNAPDKVALTDAAGDDAQPPDTLEIARQIAFALAQAPAAEAASDD